MFTSLSFSFLAHSLSFLREHHHRHPLSRHLMQGALGAADWRTKPALQKHPTSESRVFVIIWYFSKELFVIQSESLPLTHGRGHSGGGRLTGVQISCSHAVPHVYSSFSRHFGGHFSRRMQGAPGLLVRRTNPGLQTHPWKQTSVHTSGGPAHVSWQALPQPPW